MTNRRKFLSQSSLLLAGSTIALNNDVFAYLKNKTMPADQLNIGAIGINGMGWSNVKAALKVPGVNLVAVCDIDKNVIGKRLAELEKAGGNISGIKQYDDYRKLLEPFGEKEERWGRWQR